MLLYLDLSIIHSNLYFFHLQLANETNQKVEHFVHCHIRMNCKVTGSILTGCLVRLRDSVLLGGSKRRY